MDTISITLLIAIIGCGVSVASFSIAISKDNLETVFKRIDELSENINGTKGK